MNPHFVLYDDECPLCTFQMRVLSWMDWLNVLALVPLSDVRAKSIAPTLERSDLLEATLDPNKGISEQYTVFHITKHNGKEEAVGMVVEENNDSVKVLVDPLRGTTQSIGKFLPPKRELLPISPMPPGLVNSLTKEEILDLLAYLESGATPAAQ